MNLALLTGSIVSKTLTLDNFGNLRFIKFVMLVGSFQSNNPQFINCVAFNSNADYLIKNCTFGSIIEVKGEVTSKKIFNKETQSSEHINRIYVVEVICLSRPKNKSRITLDEFFALYSPENINKRLAEHKKELEKQKKEIEKMEDIEELKEEVEKNEKG